MFVGHTRHCLMVLILMVCSFDHGEAGGCRTAGLHNFTSGWSKTSKTHSFLRCVVPLTMGIHMLLLSLFIIKNTPPIGTQGDYELEVHGLSGKEFSKKNVKHRWIVGGEYCVQTMEKACGCWAWMARSGLLRMWIIMRSLSFFTCLFANIVWQQGRMKQQLLVGGLEHFFYDFPYIGNVIKSTDEVIFFRRVGQPPTSHSLVFFFF